MKVLCFSSFTFSYLNRARVLFASLRRFHPDWELVALITDEPPPGFVFDPAQEPFDRVVYAEELGLPFGPLVLDLDAPRHAASGAGDVGVRKRSRADGDGTAAGAEAGGEQGREQQSGHRP